MSLNEQFTSDIIYSMAVRFDLKVCQPLVRLVCSWQRPSSQNVLPLSIINCVLLVEWHFPIRRRQLVYNITSWQFCYSLIDNCFTQPARLRLLRQHKTYVAHTEHARYFAAHHFVISNNTLQRYIVVTVLLWQCYIVVCVICVYSWKSPMDRALFSDRELTEYVRRPGFDSQQYHLYFIPSSIPKVLGQ